MPNNDQDQPSPTARLLHPSVVDLKKLVDDRHGSLLAELHQANAIVHTQQATIEARAARIEYVSAERDRAQDQVHTQQVAIDLLKEQLAIADEGWAEEKKQAGFLRSSLDIKECLRRELEAKLSQSHGKIEELRGQGIPPDALVDLYRRGNA